MVLIRRLLQLPAFHHSVLVPSSGGYVPVFNITRPAQYQLLTVCCARKSSGFVACTQVRHSSSILRTLLPVTMRGLVNFTPLTRSSSPEKPKEDLNKDQNCCSRPPQGNTVEEKYQAAVEKLNCLQSNAKTLDKIRQNRDQGAYKNIPDVIQFASRIGVELDRLDELSCIHVAGTKGKGSVCAFTESILRSCGFKTGFFSSPHLVQVRERIRINGQPISKEDFADYFFTVFSLLDSSKAQFDGKMPAYFRFLTLMAFHIFLEEKVDVAIMEVGIGGEYDCTNIIRKPVVVGITSLGMDHISILGDTLDKIAWHKAGIIKPGRPAYTVPQPEDSIQVILHRAREKKAPLEVTPSLMAYDFLGHDVTLGLAGSHQHQNATLALQLARQWVMEEHPGKFLFDVQDELISKRPRMADTPPATDEVLAQGDVPQAEAFAVPADFIRGLKSCYWPGRNQTVKRSRITYYLDGAHTPRSITACCKWFRQKAEEEAESVDGPVARILIFNSTGDRDEFSLLPRLVTCGFHGVVFCPNVISLYNSDSAADSMNYTTTTERQLARCHLNLVAFQKLLQQHKSDVLALTSPSRSVQVNGNHHPASSLHHSLSGATPPEEESNNIGQSSNGMDDSDKTGCDRHVNGKLVKLSSITDALHWAACAKDPNLSSPSIHDPTPSDKAIAANHIQVLVTGSIHLVGGVISVLDPELVSQPRTE